MVMRQDGNTPLEDRACGVLLHPSSLPSRWGIGDLGRAARQFATRLGAAGQRYWQVLPLNPTTAAADDSPYFSNSSRAGNPLLINLEDLAQEGLLDGASLEPPLAASAETVDFELARRSKGPLLRAAARHAQATRGEDPEFVAFCEREHDWLEDHALFTALRAHHGSDWRHWPEDLKRRQPEALAAARSELADEVVLEQWLQFLFQHQWQRLHRHCRDAGVWLFGDMPIYVNIDSADVWASPGVFKLDSDLNPTAESGVPPDYFSATGQLWRNPVYNWPRLEQDGFRWWQRRLGTLLRRFDVLRIDHFRGLVQYWEVPANSDTAIHGHWEDVPSEAFFTAMRQGFDTFPVVAEDLGTITPDVHEIRDRFGFPGMIILHFAFSGDPNNPYLPAHHRENAVVYLGTHDNNTTRGWYEDDLDEGTRAQVNELASIGEGGDGSIGIKSSETVDACLELLLSSKARIAVVSAQDLLALGSQARMNTPGEPAGNWRWQLTEAQFEALPLGALAERCAVHDRLPGADAVQPGDDG